MDACDSIIARMNTTTQSMASCFQKPKKKKTKKQKNKKPKKKKTNKEEERNKSSNGKYCEIQMKRKDVYACEGGNWGSWPRYARIIFEGHADFHPFKCTTH